LTAPWAVSTLFKSAGLRGIGQHCQGRQKEHLHGRRGGSELSHQAVTGTERTLWLFKLLLKLPSNSSLSSS
jgi:hypothetical protein